MGMSEPRYTIDEIGLRLINGAGLRTRLARIDEAIRGATQITQQDDGSVTVNIAADPILAAVIGSIMDHLISTRHLPTPASVEAIHADADARDELLRSQVEDALRDAELRRLID